MKLPEAPIALSEVAKKWNKRIEDLIAWIVDGKMKAYCWYEDNLHFFEGMPIKHEYDHYRGWVMVSGGDIEPLQVKRSVKLKHVSPFSHDTFSRNVGNNYKNIPESVDHTITTTDLVVMVEEVSRMESEYKELVQAESGELSSENLEIIEKMETKNFPIQEEKEQSAAEDKPDLRKVFDKDHPWHSQQLLLAINAWMALYGNRKDSPAEFKPPGGNIALIVEWLDRHKANMAISATTVQHIATLVNPDKSKGPRKTRN